MTAQPIHEPDPYDPAEILRVLPARYHELFLKEYRVSWEKAREPGRYRELRELLHTWRLQAALFASPGFEEGHQALRDGRVEGAVSADQVIPGWSDRR